MPLALRRRSRAALNVIVLVAIVTDWIKLDCERDTGPGIRRPVNRDYRVHRSRDAQIFGLICGVRVSRTLRARPLRGHENPFCSLVHTFPSNITSSYENSRDSREIPDKKYWIWVHQFFSDRIEVARRAYIVRKERTFS